MLALKTSNKNNLPNKARMSKTPFYQEPPSFAFPVIRSAAFEKLRENRLPSKRLSWINAPTGYGKTVLMSSLYNHFVAEGIRASWVCLNEPDDSAERVLIRLESLFLGDEQDFSPSANVHKSDEPLEQRIETLCALLRGEREPRVLFIDNLDYCRDDTLGALVEALLFQCGEGLHLVLASTREPTMTLHRITLAGLVEKFGYADLVLRHEQIPLLLGDELSHRIGDEGISRIASITEGWPAAVRLLQIILSDAGEPAQVLDTFTGSDVDLANMLNHTLINKFDEAFRGFLLRISVLSKFSESLCQQVTLQTASADYVQRLIDHNLFIIPLDRNKSEYRLHSLFREFLRGEAERQLSKDELREVQIRAASWSEERGRWHDAINYAIAAGDYAVATSTLDRVAADFVRDKGDLSRFIDWVENITSSGFQPGWETDFWYVWALVFHRRYDYAAKQLQRLQQRLNSGEVGSDVDKLEMARRLEIIAITIATYTDRLAEMQEKARQWLLHAENDDPFDVATVACAVGIHNSGHFDFLRAREYFGIAHESIAQADSDYGQGWVDVLSSLVAIHEGDFGQAYDKSLATLTKIRNIAGDNAGMTSTVASLAARCAVEVGRDSEASNYLKLALPRVQTHGVLDTAALALDAAVKLWASPLGDGISIMELREIASGFPARLNKMLSCFLTQRLLRLGRIEEAQEEAAKMGITTELLQREIRLPLLRFQISQTLLDLEIATGMSNQIEARLIDEINQAKRDGRTGHLVELALMQMTATLRSPNPEHASRHLTRAVSYAARRRLIRPFRDRADLIAGLVNETRAKSWGFALPEEKAFFGEICQMLPIANSAILDHLENLDVESKLLEALTPRELELLNLIDAGLTNQQLADRLFVSVATVKWHLYNLYNKLSVANRSGAIAKARALNLISH